MFAWDAVRIWVDEENEGEENYEDAGNNHDISCCKFLGTKWMTMFDQQTDCQTSHDSDVDLLVLQQTNCDATNNLYPSTFIFRCFDVFIASNMNDECLICPASDICAAHMFTYDANANEMIKLSMNIILRMKIRMDTMMNAKLLMNGDEVSAVVIMNSWWMMDTYKCYSIYADVFCNAKIEYDDDAKILTGKPYWCRTRWWLWWWWWEWQW